MTETPETEPGASTRAPGAILKQARIGKDLSIAAIATQLNLDLRVVEALESGDLSKLPAPIFVRGYLRGYARLVGVREEEVLAAYQAQAPKEPAPRSVGMPRKSMPPAFRVPVIPWRGLVGAAILLGVIALAFEIGPSLLNRVNSDDGGEPAQPSSLPLPVPNGASSIAPVSDASPRVPDASGNLSLALPEPAPRAAEDLQSPALEEVEPSTPSDTDFGLADPSGGIDSLPAAAAPAALPADQVQLEFIFNTDSWVEVRAADRSKLLYGLLREGDDRIVTGKAPIAVLLGNAAAVTLKVNGEVFDHARYNRDNVARFNVPAQP